MRTRTVGLAGRDYLDCVTQLLIACRSEDPLGGLWDAGDLQRWWRDDYFNDPHNQIFWIDAGGRTLGFLLLSHEFRTFDYEVLPSLEEPQIST